MSDELVKRHVEQLRMTGGMYEHPGYRKPYPIQTVLRDLASQEGCDGEPYDAMVFAASYIDCIIAHIAALTAQVAEAREQRADAEARMETAEVECDRLREAVRGLERASTEVASCGARTVPHWLKLTVANLSAREALKGESHE